MFLHCGNFKLELSRPQIMGIVNVTPDSFSDGGKHLSNEAAIAHAMQLVEDGADILDIGGESTRPGAAVVSEAEELARVIPVIEGLRNVKVPISIDTYKPAVMRAALHAGASMVNDINALQEEEALSIVADSHAAVCLMHRQGDSKNMQLNPHYADVTTEVIDFLLQRVSAVTKAGISSQRIVLDPGFGFGKTLAHNLKLLNEFNELCKCKIPVLAGISRKSMLGQITGRGIEQRVASSIAAALIAVQRGAAIVRVHDVRETRDVLKIWAAVNNPLDFKA
ncbi:MAG: dihydropteroate synthase [Gallionellaceae bacterium]|jgi:dihydropteroate synthase